ncbi:MAG TPA: hypothetical protein VMV89_01485 [Candidatus Paceibacterota bacterium]|nr:hypothetical protein [Candidatus Paceibacterota bacterium]
MNDFELQSKLKSVPLPGRTEEYWEDFPARVRVQLRRAAPEDPLAEYGLPQFAWRLGASFACLVIGLFVFGRPLQAASNAIFKNERTIRRQLAELPHHLRVLMADEHGLHYLVAEKQ